MKRALASRHRGSESRGRWSPAPALGRVQGQRSSGATQSKPATTGRAGVVERARGTAMIRTLQARDKTAGLTAPIPGRELGDSALAQLETRNLARRMFLWDNPNMAQVHDILDTMLTHLGPRMRWEAAPATDKNCSGRNAYVAGYRPPMHLCPAFFGLSPEEQVHTLIHESAHLARIGDPASESYDVSFGETDCDGLGVGFDAADAWAKYVTCASRNRRARQAQP